MNESGRAQSGPSHWPVHPFDDDKLHEECGVYGVFGVDDAANYVALGLHALQHRGQEAAGIVSYDPATGFNNVKRIGYVRDNFTKQSVMDLVAGRSAIGHTRYSTAGGKGAALDLPVHLGHRVSGPSDGPFDSEDDPRADEGRASPGRRRLLGHSHDPDQDDRGT